MSTTNPQGTPAADPTAQIQQAIDQVVSKPAGMPLEINLATGEVYKASTPEELLTKLASSKEEATRTIRARESEMAELRSKIADLETKIPAPQPSLDETKRAKYYDTWANDPDEATRQQLASLLGIPKDRVIDVMKAAITSSVVSKAADEFVMRCPDYPNSQQSAEIMKDALARRFGQTIESASADNMEIVYHQLVRDGMLNPQPMPVTGITQPNTPLPNLRGGSAPPNPVTDIMATAQSMPLDQLKAVIDRLHVQTQGR